MAWPLPAAGYPPLPALVLLQPAVLRLSTGKTCGVLLGAVSSEGSACPKRDQKPRGYVRRTPEQQPGRVGAAASRGGVLKQHFSSGTAWIRRRRRDVERAANAYTSAGSTLSVMVTFKNVSVSTSPSAALI